MVVILQARSFIDAVATALRERILTGDIAPGMRLAEKSVAAQYAVARPTAKAAIERLTQEGLLRRGPHKTARVPIMGPGNVKDLYFSRTLLECQVVAELARDHTVTTAVRASLKRCWEYVEKADITGMVEADIAFHVALVEALHSPRVMKMYGSIIGEMHLCMAQVQAHGLLPSEVIVNEHAGILTAIEDGDPQLASGRLEAHLSRARDQLLGFFSDDGSDRDEPLTSEMA